MSVGTVYNDAREIAPGIWWLPQCLAMTLLGRETHLHNAPYLIVGAEKTLLFDAGLPNQWEDIRRSVQAVLGDRPLDYLVPSHPEMAHCGNVPRLMALHPQVRLLGDVRDYRLYFPQFADRMIHRPVGAELDLGGHRFTFVEAVIKDLPSTQWGYEPTQQVLFVADGFAYSHQPPLDGDDRPTHAPGQCAKLATELGRPPSEDQVVWITKSALYWTRFVRIDRLRGPLQAVLDRHPTKVIAPAHGAVIDDVDGLLWTVWDALRLSYNPQLGVAQAGAGTADRG